MTPTCCLCGADETQGPLDPRRCYGHPAGSVRCVSINECALRAELRDVMAERDSAVAQQAQHYADLLTAEQRIDALRAEVDLSVWVREAALRAARRR